MTFVAPKPNIAVRATVWDTLWAWNNYPGGPVAWLKAVDKDLWAMGATHKMIGVYTNCADFLIEADCAGAQGLKLIVGLPHHCYAPGKGTGNDRPYMWLFGEALKLYRYRYLRNVWTHLWGADDLSPSDHWDAPLMRAKFRDLYPDKKYLVTPSDPGYMRLPMMEPKPDVCLLQAYTGFGRWVKEADGSRDEAYIDAKVKLFIDSIRPQDGLIYQAFGEEDFTKPIGELDYYAAQSADELLAFMKRTWLVGKGRELIGAFTAFEYGPGRKALYYSDVLARTWDLPSARTDYWYAFKHFSTWVRNGAAA